LAKSTYPEHGLQGLRFLSSHSGMYIPNWGPATLFDPATKFIPDSSALSRKWRLVFRVFPRRKLSHPAGRRSLQALDA
ncbi:MAG: hypothetical protein J0H15_11200, partial [Xanthomonadales bacterium]|nr:hypothetical protein [Xanthomonadales bacterium]